MAYQVWTWKPDYAVNWSRRFDERNIPLGTNEDGAYDVVTAMHEIPDSRADGTGSVSTKKGTNFWDLIFRRKNFTGEQDFIDMLNFLQARKEANNEAFYFYNPSEKTTPDGTGTDTTGRYLVKQLGPISAAMRYLLVYDFATMTFREARDEYR